LAVPSAKPSLRFAPAKRHLILIPFLSVIVSCTSGGVSQTKPGQVMASIRAGLGPGTVSVNSPYAWVPDTREGKVSQVDVRSNRVVRTVRIGDAAAFYQRDCAAYGSVHSFMVTTFHVRDCDLPSALAATAQATWVLGNDDHTVVRLDPKDGREITRVPLAMRPWGIAADARAVWATSYLDDVVVKVDPQSNRPVGRIAVPGGPTNVALGLGGAWVVSSRSNSVSLIDPSSNRVVKTVAIPCPTACPFGPTPLAIAIAAGSVWVRNERDSTLSRIDPERGQVTATYPVDAFYGRDGLDAMALADGAIWLGGVQLQRFDLRTATVRRIDLSATTVADGAGSLWVTDIAGTLLRLETGR
jgi:DNA-binding beta-propeller fold protein YncE